MIRSFDDSQSEITFGSGADPDLKNQIDDLQNSRKQE